MADEGEKSPEAEDTQAQLSATRERIESAQEKLQSAISDIGDFDKKWKSFQDRFDAVTQAMITSAFGRGSQLPKKSGPAPLSSIDLDGVAEHILSGRCKRIGFLTGAGVSVASGIPDFRSAGGMYDTLRPELLTATKEQRETMALSPTHVVSWSLFSKNSLPYLELRRPFILGTLENRWKATLAHWFIYLCHLKGLLQRLYTQNIDGLDFQTGLPPEKIISVHGNMATVSCEFCRTPMARKDFCEQVRTGVRDIYTEGSEPVTSTPVVCSGCGKPGVKPDTVLYGRSLPDSFGQNVGDDMKQLDLLIVAGTSLTVSPANSLVRMVPDSCAVLVVNRDKVGEDMGLDFETRDVFVGDDCDNAFRELARKLGWGDELAALLPEQKR